MIARVSALSWLFAMCIHSVTAQESPAVSYSLQDIFQLADDHSKAIELASQAIEVSEEQVDIAREEKLPDVHFSAVAAYMPDAGVLGLNSGYSTGFYTVPHFYNTFSLEAVYSVYAGGNINREISISEIKKEMASLEHRVTRMDIRLLLAGYYLDLYTAQNQQEVLTKNIEQTNVLLREMRNRLAAGTILRSDLIRYELRLSNLEFSRKQISNRIDILNHKLTEILDLPEDTYLVAKFVENRQPLEAGSLMDDALSGNLELQAAHLKTEIAEQDIAVNKGHALPQVALFISSSFNRPFIYDLPMLDIYANLWFAGVKVSYNIGSLYKNKTHVHEAQIQWQQSVTSLELQEEKTRIKLHEAIVNYQETIEHLPVAEKEVELASENYDMVINQYQNEAALITDVMDASNSKLNAELQLENARASIIFSFYQLQRITGNL